METQSEILMLKLSSGEEIIGECIVESVGVSVKNACTISVTGNEGKKQSISFAIYAPLVKESTIYLTSYIWVAKVLDEVESRYKDIFSPIILPESKIQLV